MRYLVLITARAGSKRLPHKNVKLLGGFPLIWYTLHILRGSGRHFPEPTAMAISTEDPMIMSVVAAFPNLRDLHKKGLIPIARPPELAQDDTEHMDVVRHAVNQFPADSFDAVLTLHPTSPFRAASDLGRALSLADQKPILNTVGVNPQGVRNAAIYITPISELFEEGRTKIYNPDSQHSPMGAIHSLDINTQEDWDFAEKLIKENPDLEI